MSTYTLTPHPDFPGWTVNVRTGAFFEKVGYTPTGRLRAARNVSGTYIFLNTVDYLVPLPDGVDPHLRHRDIEAYTALISRLRDAYQADHGPIMGMRDPRPPRRY